MGIVLVVAIIICGIIIYKLVKKNSQLSTNIKSLQSQKKSAETRFGQAAEHFVPFLEDFKHHPSQAKFLGQPVDFVIFTPEKLVFLEVKSGQSQLSTKQRKIRDLIKDGKVEWEEIRVKS